MVTGQRADRSAAESVAAEIRDMGHEAIANVDSVASAEAIVAAALDAWGRVDIVVNNAGFVDDALFDDMTAERFEPLADVHLKGADIGIKVKPLRRLPIRACCSGRWRALPNSPTPMRLPWHRR